MIWAIARFELKRRLSRPSTYIYFVLFFAIAFLTMIAAGGAFSSVQMGFGGGKAHVNSPHALMQLISLISYFGLLVTGAVAGQAVYQDFHANIHPFFFTAPLREGQYLTGRFLGAFLVLLLIFASIGLGCWAGSQMFFVERSLFGANRAAAYFSPYLLSVIPNLFFTGALFFGLAALTRKIFPVYVTSVVLLVGYLMAATLSAKLENKTFAALLDPFGLQAVGRMTEYWTVAEKNSRLVPLEGVFLANRLLWMSVGAAVLALTARRFRFLHLGEGGRRRAPTPEPAATTLLPTPSANAGGPLRRLPGLCWLAFRETVKNVYFVVIVLAGVLFVIVAAQTLGSIYGTNTYPVTYEVLELAGGSFSLFVIILITFYSGELAWRQRDARVDQLFDVLPIPTWLPFVANLLALILVQVLLLAVVMVCGLAIQVFKGYFHFELGLYLRELFGLRLVEYALLCVLAMFVQVLVNQKYVGHFVMVVYYLATAFMGRFGLEHNLYRYGSAPEYTYSDMNGYGHFLRPVLWFDLYWAAFAVLLAVASTLFWVRGLETRFGKRVALARERFTRRTKMVAAVASLAFAGLGCFIYYNTNVLNLYRTHKQRLQLQVDYEKRYKPHEHDPQPRITDIDVAVDIFPDQRRLLARGKYRLTNKTGAPLFTVYVGLGTETIVHRLAIGGLDKASVDQPLGIRTFQLATPLAPAAEITLEFEIEIRSRGFKNSDPDTSIVENGTFFSTGELPQIGYQSGAELTDDDERKKHGLGPKERMADVADLSARKNNYVSSDADWVTFAATVSTSADQLAVAPGALEREWTQDGRRYFRYRTDRPELNLFAILSARYEVRRDRWNNVDIEIDYHKGHEYDLDRMVKAVKSALDYQTANFSPYQHKLVRIIEFPRYGSFAQSLPNTIPYSEAVGFIAKVDPTDDEDIDYPFYVTAHEVAHQWWAHQVIGGNVQGATMLSETLAQYSALMIMKKEFGAEKMHRFLRYELNRYLIGRAFERKKELPLYRVENQLYIHYQKGSLVMYALQDYLGEATVNHALASWLHDVAWQQPPYTNSVELLTHLRKATPPELQYLIEDLFETITLYDNRVTSATFSPKGDKQFEVELTVSTKKLRADELGVEKPAKLDDLIDVGVYGENGKLLFLEKRRFKDERTELSVIVSEPPVKAGIDPLNKLIDRKADDNLMRVTKAGLK